jgi:MYXO-CTERM domain-containing protein
VQTHLGVDTLPTSAPHCTLCHRNDSGGTDSVTKPFGLAMRAKGALPNNIPSIDSALDQLEAAGTDSDGDGTSDIDELREGTNPNEGDGTAPSSLEQIPLPQTGCSVSGSASAPRSESASWVLAGLLLVVVRRARRR